MKITVTRADILASARTLLDWLEVHPEVPIPSPLGAGAYLTSYTGGLQQMQAAARALREVCPKLKKVMYSYYLSLEAEFGPWKFCVDIERSQVCTAKVTSVFVPEHPAIEAHYEDKVVWECPDSLFDTEQK